MTKGKPYKFQVQKELCSTCIFKKESGFDLRALLKAITDRFGFFKGYRECHHAKRGSGVCCRGFWNAYKDDFATGQIAQRLDLVEYVEVDVLPELKAKEKRPCS